MDRSHQAEVGMPGDPPSGGVPDRRREDHRRPYLMLPPPVRSAAAWSVAVILLITVASLVVFALVELRAATVPVILSLLGTSLLYRS
ncbi:hypothetical protein [Kitasatospora sp. NPDC047058]|uniref:hypothetical protein n=1 Tax=Kitasatospora sp. NPDC047058 TaxID=3155620 RepID=UPI0033FA0707